METRQQTKSIRPFIGAKDLNKSGSNKRKIQLPFAQEGVSDMQILADGKSVVFNYLEYPVYSVYTMNFDGTNLVKILGGNTDYVEIVSTAAFVK